MGNKTLTAGMTLILSRKRPIIVRGPAYSYLFDCQTDLTFADTLRGLRCSVHSRLQSRLDD